MLSGNYIINDISRQAAIVSKLGILLSKLGYFISVC